MLRKLTTLIDTKTRYKLSIPAKTILCLVLSLSATLAWPAVQNEPAVQTEIEPAASASAGLSPAPKSPDSESTVFLIRLVDPPLASYSGEIEALAATSPEVTGRKLDRKNPTVRAYLEYLSQRQDSALGAMTELLGRSPELVYRYRAGNNGMAVRLTAEEAKRVEQLPAVTYVEESLEYVPQGDRTAEWIGATGVWDGSTTGGLGGSAGEGVVIGFIDTGINPLNPSFLDVGGDGYDHTNPWGSEVYVGVCDSGDPTHDPTFPCNDKLIGARGYVEVNGGDPTDTDGHGSRTASAAAGNRNVLATVNAPTTAFGMYISGVAPHANIVAYAACCSTSSLAAAIDDAILDGIDVINYAIGSTADSDPWSSFTTFALLTARAAGVSVATASVNAGPGPGTIGSPGNAPWVIWATASSHDREFPNMLYNMVGGSAPPPSSIIGKGLTSAYGPAPIVHARDFGDGQCLAPRPRDFQRRDRGL